MPAHLQETSSRHQSLRLHSTKEGTTSTLVTCPIESESRAPLFHASPVSGSTVPQELQLPEMTGLQSEFIADTMDDLRERAAKRQKIGDVERATLKHADEKESLFYLGGDDDSIASGQFDILEELDEHPHVAQIVATAGGLVVHWNEAFTEITKPSTSLRKIPLSIFELVDSKSLSSLYSMLALSLHNIAIDTVENFHCGEEEECFTSVREGDQIGDELRPSSHLSVTLPCKSFPASPLRYNITLIFMNETHSSERCFLGILAPRPKVCNGEDDSLSSHDGGLCIQASTKIAEETNGIVKDSRGVNEVALPFQLPCGRILRIEDESLCQMLCSNAIE